MRESSGRTTSTMSPAPMPFEVARRGAADAGSSAGATSTRRSWPMPGTLGRGPDGLPHPPVHGDVLLPVRADVDERRAVAAQRVVERDAEGLRRGDADVRAAV